MESNWAEENLQTIRTLMERSAIYRRALAPISTYVGAVGIIAALIGWLLKLETILSFGIYWMVASGVALSGALFLVRRQALKDSEIFWSPPTRRIAQAMFPALLAGMVLGLSVACYFGGTSEVADAVLVFLWTLLFGLALHSAGFFMPRGIRLFGWIFITAGLLMGVGFFLSPFRGGLVWGVPPNIMMGMIFGGLHLAYGIYLYFTEPRKNEA